MQGNAARDLKNAYEGSRVMKNAMIAAVVLAACGSPRQALPPTVHEQLAAMDEPADAAVDAEPDAEVDADLAFIAQPDAAPEITFADVGEVAATGVNVAVSRVMLDKPVSDYGATDTDDSEPSEAYENGVRVIFVNNRIWCATSGTEMCGVSEPSCRRITGVNCRLSPNRACTSATSRTDGTDNYACFASYGACARFKAVASVEYDIDDCVVLRYRKGAE
jgi:hypothetical protein